MQPSDGITLLPSPDLKLSQPVEALVSLLRNRTEVLTLHHLTLLLNVEISQSDLEPFIHFDLNSYTRNLIYRNSFVELFCMCWKPGQQTLIHDHGNSACGTRIVEGEALEDLFMVAGEKDPLAVLKNGPPRIVKAGDITVATLEAIHQVTNDIRSKKNLITIQVYSPPLTNFNIYNLLK